jgi:hypothetical protein
MTRRRAAWSEITQLERRHEVVFQKSLWRQPLLWGLVALFAAIVADLLQALVDPVNGGEGARVVAGATSEHGRMVTAAILVLLSAMFVVPGVVGLTRLLESRGRRVGQAAMVLALLGALGHAALGGIYLVWAVMPAETGAQPELVAAIDRANESASMAVLAPLFFAFPVSLVVFFVAMVRGRLAARWVLVPALAAPAAAIASIGSDPVPTVTALVFLLVASMALAVRLLSRSNQRRTDTVSAPVLA